MHMPRNAISWFEIPVSQFNRAREFYSAILNIAIRELQMEGNRLGLLAFDNNGASGAIVEGTDYLPSQRGCVIYLDCGDDLTEVLARIPAAGGRIERDKTPVSPDTDLGYHAIFLDSEGNRIGLRSRK